MCAKMRKAGERLITLAKYIFMGLFITRYNGNIATCYQMNEKKRHSQKKYSRTVKRKKGYASIFDTTSF